MMKHKLQRKLHLGKYATSRANLKKKPFHWYIYKHSFGSELFLEFCRMIRLPLGSCVFDPFCGGGTTLIQAKLSGYDSFGLDISPIAVFLTNTLVKKYNWKKFEIYYEKLKKQSIAEVNIPDVAILSKSFSRSTLKYIFSVSNKISKSRMKEKNLLLMALLRTLDDTSKCKKSGGFLRITENKRVSVMTFKSTFNQICDNIIGDLQNIPYSNAYSKAFLGDARKLPNAIKDRRFHAIFTSPPYLNRHDYTRIYALELLTGFIKNNNQLKKLRYKTLRSHVEAKEQYSINNYKAPSILQIKIDKLKKKKLNNSQIVSTIEGYFEDMWLFLKEVKTILHPNAHIGLVVGNVRFEGVNIPVDTILAELGEIVGYKLLSINILRYKGNSSQQMKKYKRRPSRESMIIWQNRTRQKK